jgi:hypothetical protein
VSSIDRSFDEVIRDTHLCKVLIGFSVRKGVKVRNLTRKLNRLLPLGVDCVDSPHDYTSRRMKRM